MFIYKLGDMLYMHQTASSFSCLSQLTFCSKYPDKTYSNDNCQAPRRRQCAPTLDRLVCIGCGANNAMRASM